jgi:hypothetical protein
MRTNKESRRLGETHAFTKKRKASRAAAKAARKQRKKSR